MAVRDDFSSETKITLAKRVGMRCSNPDGAQLTSGPQEDPTKAINIGVAAHISAASTGGPRYDYRMSPQQRSSTENGIWLCQNCAKLVDNDEVRYTADLLRDWKHKSEEAARLQVESPLKMKSRVIADDPDADIPANGSFPQAKARLVEGDAALPLFHPNTKSCSGRFIIANKTPRPFNITWIDLGKGLPKVNLVSTHNRPEYGKRGPYDQKLPLYINGYERKQVFFITEDIVRPVEGGLPDNVRLDVTIDDHTTLSLPFRRKGNTHQYASEHAPE